MDPWQSPQGTQRRGWVRLPASIALELGLEGEVGALYAEKRKRRFLQVEGTLPFLML